MFFSQVTDPISGGAGWIGAGITTSMLGWLLFVHLPNTMKQAKEQNQMLLDVIAARDVVLKEMSTEFHSALDKVLAHCEAHCAKEKG